MNFSVDFLEMLTDRKYVRLFSIEVLITEARKQQTNKPMQTTIQVIREDGGF